MSRPSTAAWWLAAAFVLAACPSEPSTGADGSVAAPDAATVPPDGSAGAPDAQEAGLDAAPVGPDAATPLDASLAADAAADTDAGGTPDGGPDLSEVCACKLGGLGECPIQALQNAAHPCYAGQRSGIVVEDVVVLTPPLSTGFWAGEPEGGAWSGVWVYVPNGVARPWLWPGDVITVTGTTSEYYGRTQLSAASIALTGRGTVPAPADVTTAQICTTCAEAEQWEGVAVRLSDVQVSTADFGYGEFGVSPIGGGVEARVDDLFAPWFSYAHGATDAYSALSGVLDYSYNAFKIEPRECADFLDLAGDPYCLAPVCPTGPVPVAQVHDVTRADAVPVGCFVWLEEAVMTTAMAPLNATFNTGWIQQGRNPHGGLRLASQTGTDVSALVPGAKAALFGYVDGAAYSRIFLVKVVDPRGAGQVPDPIVLTPAEAGGHVPDTWGWESMLVKTEDVVTVVPRPLLEFGVDANGFEVARASAPEAHAIVHGQFAGGFVCPWPRLEQKCATDQRAFGQHFASITGNLYWWGETLLFPRGSSDLVLAACDAADADCDGAATASDTCPAFFDPGQADADSDGLGDACDVCVATAQTSSVDGDGDGVGDECDDCPAIADPDQRDTDTDGAGDACDADRDGDGVDEGDGATPCTGGAATGCQDNCPLVANAGQEDSDADGRGDACEGARAPIVFDGLMDDWAALAPVHVDASGDRGPGGLDFAGLWMADDGEHLYLRVDLGRETMLAENNDLRVYLDTDANAATGLAIAGLGADLEWQPGARQGILHGATGNTTLGWAAAGFASQPTVSARQFELAFALDARPDGTNLLFAGAHVRVALRDGTDGDQLPDGDGGVPYHLGLGAAPAAPAVDLARQQAQDLRIASWNVLADGPWASGNGPRFQRMMSAMAPDVVVLQEVASHGVADAVALVGGAIPGTWEGRKVGSNVLVSRLPIQASWQAGEGQLLVLVDATAKLGKPIAIGDIHLPCCQNWEARRLEIDGTLRALRHLSRETNEIPAGTPVLLAGDFNLVDVAATRDGFLTGDVTAEWIYGPDFHPDPAGLPFRSLVSLRAGTRWAPTWEDAASAFGPGYLDYVLYTGSLLEVGNHFSVSTARLTDAQLLAVGLEKDDSSLSDHLLRITDVRPAP